MDKLTDIKSYIKSHYNYDIGDSGALLVAVLKEGHSQHSNTIKQAVDRIHHSQQSFHTDNPKAAFWYGVGKLGLWILPVLALICLGAWFYQNQQTAIQISHLLARYPNADYFQFLMQDGQIEKAKDGGVYLVLTQAPRGGSIQAGKHYVYDSQCACIRIPLFYK